MSPRGGKREGAGRKPVIDPRDTPMPVRVSAGRLQAYREAAERAGMSLTEWVEVWLDTAAGDPGAEMLKQAAEISTAIKEDAE